jgi:hypothetical protein
MQMSIDGFVDSDVPGPRWRLWDWGPNWTWTPDARAQFNALFASAAAILLSRPTASESYLDQLVPDRRTAPGRARLGVRSKYRPASEIRRHPPRVSAKSDWAVI